MSSLWCSGWIADRSQWNRPLGRLLVLLTGLLTLVMPLTEHMWDKGHFLRGGNDVEFSLLAGLLFAAMIVLAMHRGINQSLFAVFLIWCGGPILSRTLAQSWSAGQALSPRFASLSFASLSTERSSRVAQSASCTPLRI